jgi:hypothetical protein
MIVIALSMMLYRTYTDRSNLEEGNRTLSQAQRVLTDLRSQRRDYRDLGQAVGDGEEKQKERLRLFAYRNYWPSVQKLISWSVQGVAEHQNLYYRALTAPTRKQREELLGQLRAIPRRQRSLVFLERMDAQYVPDTSQVTDTMLERRIFEELGIQSSSRAGLRDGEQGNQPVTEEQKRGFLVWIVCRTTLSQERALADLINPMRANSERYADQRLTALSVLGSNGVEAAGAGEPGTPGGGGPSPGPRPGVRPTWGAEDEGRRRGPRSPSPSPTYREDGAEGQAMADPVFQGETTAGDARIGVIWLLSIDEDGLNLEPRQDRGEATAIREGR